MSLMSAHRFIEDEVSTILKYILDVLGFDPPS
jgi:hypothetical protein